MGLRQAIGHALRLINRMASIRSRPSRRPPWPARIYLSPF
jgi:hypothetical protein